MPVVAQNVFHIVSITTWAGAGPSGEYRPESLATEGFIHFSFADQVAATANRYYRDLDGLQVLEVDPARITDDLRAEQSPATGELFPHLYGPLAVDAVVAIHPLPRDEAGDFIFGGP
jgi:uncharacterized protein (DUF952 family)